MIWPKRKNNKDIRSLLLSRILNKDYKFANQPSLKNKSQIYLNKLFSILTFKLP